MFKSIHGWSLAQNNKRTNQVIKWVLSVFIKGLDGLLGSVIIQCDKFDLTPHQVKGPIEYQGTNKSIANPKLIKGPMVHFLQNDFMLSHYFKKIKFKTGWWFWYNLPVDCLEIHHVFLQIWLTVIVYKAGWLWWSHIHHTSYMRIIWTISRFTWWLLGRLGKEGINLKELAWIVVIFLCKFLQTLL